MGSIICGDTFWQRLDKAEEEFQQKKGRMAWFCSYTPLEIIASCGLQPYRFYGQEGTSFYADSFLHSSLCFFVRGCLERVLKEKEEIAGMVLVNSCLAMSHFYYALQKYSSTSFIYLLDLPRHASKSAQKYWALQLRKFHHSLGEYFGVEVAEAELWEQINLYGENRRRLKQLYLRREGKVTVDGFELIRLAQAFTNLPPADFKDFFELYNRNCLHKKKELSGPRIFLAGSTMPLALTKLIHELGGVLVLDDLCIGRRIVQFGNDSDLEPAASVDPYLFLARQYLQREPCARMEFAGKEKLERLEERLKRYRIDGIIFFYLKFCDPWYYYGQLLKEKMKDIPVLILEGEYSSTKTGQLRTRISAFLEMIG